MPPNEDNSHYEKILATGEVKCIDDEIPFEIPKSWEWCRLGQIVQINPKNKANDEVEAAFIPMELIDATYFSSYVFKIKKWKNIKSGFTHFANGDIAFAKITPCFQNRKSMILRNLPNGIGAGTTELKVLRPYSKTINDFYLLFFLESAYFVEQAIFKGTANQQRIISGYMETKLFPLPPISEQIRIAHKLEELLLLADKYNKSQVALKMLDTEIPKLMKQSILQEAIQGKLVPQDSNDEPATVLLERIREEKKKLVASGKLKKKDLTDSTIFKGDDNKYYEKCGIKVTYIDNKIPFTIPESWQWARLGELITTKTGLAYSKPNLEIKSNKMVRVLRGGNITNGSWQMKADDVMISSEFVKPELYLRKGYFITPAVTSWENMGKTALVRECYEDVVVGGFVLMMCPFYIDGIFEEYLNHFFQSTLFQQYCRSITNKSGQAFYNLSRNKLLQLLVPIPPVKEQQRIYHKLNDALASIMSR